MGKEAAHILVEFDEEGRATFDIYTTDDSQIMIALMGLEGYIASKTGLDKEDIRELIDEQKKVSKVKAKVEG